MAMIEDLNNEILVSGASIYEIGLKGRHGKLPEAFEFERTGCHADQREASEVHAATTRSHVTK
jgi:PIN domain nuclease of toxin-antitoxin system